MNIDYLPAVQKFVQQAQSIIETLTVAIASIEDNDLNNLEVAIAPHTRPSGQVAFSFDSPLEEVQQVGSLYDSDILVTWGCEQSTVLSREPVIDWRVQFEGDLGLPYIVPATSDYHAAQQFSQEWGQNERVIVVWAPGEGEHHWTIGHSS